MLVVFFDDRILKGRLPRMSMVHCAVEGIGTDKRAGIDEKDLVVILNGLEWVHNDYARG